MQQEGVASVFLPHPASHFHPVLSLHGGPLGESTVLMADAGAGAHGFRWSPCAGTSMDIS